MDETQLRESIARLAGSVLRDEMLASFLALDIEGQLTGIAFFAHLSGENKIRDRALAILAARKEILIDMADSEQTTICSCGSIDLADWGIMPRVSDGEDDPGEGRHAFDQHFKCRRCGIEFSVPA
jgi:hypothetical protein